ncbi:nitrilase-related carbon-nitrogen hydrolase [Patulibacter defluvii]|uniref:nitrilase-related carbon-nitrogen hydrolase n=1 Tax=Patulibacter defluvii TaxID=3095358 RepID=UPI002A75225C|nr:nitrilase-related carbon-nitrogen hydrolase [Patulibacter sp. DM4]
MTVLRVALGQLAPTPGDVAANAAVIARIVADHPQADLVVLPELFLHGYDPEGVAATATTVDELAAIVGPIAAGSSTAIVLGFAERRPDGRVANAVATVGPDGTVVGTYRKTHLFGDRERAAFALGEELTVTPIGGVACGLLNCFDIEFPEPARALAQAGAGLLVTASANMEPFAEVHRLAARARALDNGLPHVYVNRVGEQSGYAFVGGSCVVDAYGTVVVDAGPDEGVTLAEVTVAARPAGEQSDYLELLRPGLPVRVAGADAGAVAGPDGGAVVRASGPRAARHAALAEQFYAEFWNAGDEAAADRLVAEDLVHAQFPADWPGGREGFKRLVRTWRQAFPDMTEEVTLLIAGDDWVASRFVLRGTHRGDFYGIPGTGRAIEIAGVDLLRFADDRIAEWIYHEDTLGIFRQLGRTPEDWGAVAQ